MRQAALVALALNLLMVVAAIAAVAFVTAILAGATGSPEIQQQFRDALEQLRTQAEAAQPK